MPWRETKSPYYIWLSEVILQQTRVEQGLPYYLKFVKNFPTIFDLANATEEKVLKLWQGLGYYSRARNLHATAKYVALECDGNFPDNYNKLLSLKGVGDYTASAIASICYNEATPVVDGNVYRVLSRYFGVETPINSGKGIKEFKALAQSVMDVKNPGDYNQAIMEFGALQCKPKNPDCLTCPLENSCVALSKKMIAVLPNKIKKLKIRKRYFNYFVFMVKGKYTVIQQRTGKGIWQNLYEFPLFETPDEVVHEELIASDVFKIMVGNTSVEITLYNEVSTIHKLSHQHLYTKFYIVEMSERPKLKTEQLLIPLDTLEDYPVPILIGKFITAYGL